MGLTEIVSIVVVVSGLIVGISRILVAKGVQVDKIESYECGFHPFSVDMVEFDVQFYVVALLFLIFDVELMLLFPWSVIFSVLPLISYIIFFVFMVILVVGIIYEWSIGGLDF